MDLNMATKKGKMIVFEGLDCCFKETQSKMLCEFLKIKFPDRDVELVDFPQYSSNSGQVIFNMLHGVFGDPAKLPPELISDIYSIDRACTWYKSMKKKYDNGTIFIVDRYTYSNCIYQTTRVDYMLDKDDPYREVSLQNFIIGVMNREFKVYKLPVPDIVLHMDMDFDITCRLLAEKTNRDVNEENTRFLRDCSETCNFFYGKVMKDDPTIFHIACNVKDELRSKEDIHADVVSAVLQLFDQDATSVETEE